MPRTKQEETGDHYKFSEEELDYWSQFESIPLEGKAGSLFLWDSRTVHAVRILVSRLQGSLKML